MITLDKNKVTTARKAWLICPVVAESSIWFDPDTRGSQTWDIPEGGTVRTHHNNMLTDFWFTWSTRVSGVEIVYRSPLIYSLEKMNRDIDFLESL